MKRAEFLDNVVFLCERHRASETSGFRTRQRNAAVKGKPRSRHLTGYGRDVVLDLRTPETISAFKVDALELGIRVVVEEDHLHLQPIGPEGRLPL